MLKIFSRYVPVKAIVLMATENLWITATMVVVVQLRAHYVGEERDLTETAAKLALVTLLCQACLYYNELYDLSVVTTRRELFIRALQGFGACAVILGVLYTVLPSLAVGRGIASGFVIVAILVLLGWRMLIGAASRMYDAPRRVLVLGTGDLAQDLARAMQSRPDLNMKVVGFLTDRPEEVGQTLLNPKVVGLADNLEELAELYNAERVVVALSDRRNRMPLGALLALKLKGVHIDDAHSLYERVTGKIRTTTAPQSWLIFSEGFRALRKKVRHKRMMDTILALLLGSVALPIAILVALAVKLSSRGPILFKQERIGLHGKAFRLVKFRTMRTDAEADGVPRWAGDGDPRITRVGRFLRKTRLDEIPQIWNVLIGDMSFVGPRPERPHFVEVLREKLSYYNERHCVRPGITGWAQINYGYGATVEDALQKLQYDLFYIKNLSLLLDLAILFETGKTVLFGRGR